MGKNSKYKPQEYEIMVISKWSFYGSGRGNEFKKLFLQLLRLWQKDQERSEALNNLKEATMAADEQVGIFMTF